MWWTDAECKRILSVLSGKNYIAAGLGYFLALRVNEARTLRVGDVDFRSMRVYVVGKGGVRDEVPMLRDAMPFWADLERWAKGQPPTSPVVPGRQEGGTISTQMLRRMLKRAALSVGVAWGDKGHFHLLRHSRLSHLKESGVDMTLVKQFARHSVKTNTEAIYTHAPVRNLGSKIDAALRQDEEELRGPRSSG